MSVLLQPIKFTDILSTVWTAVKLYIEDCYRYFYREEVTVRIKSGQVKGFKIASSYNYQYYNFLGIPYAKPPVDDLRFKVWFGLVRFTLCFYMRHVKGHPKMIIYFQSFAIDNGFVMKIKIIQCVLDTSEFRHICSGTGLHHEN